MKKAGRRSASGTGRQSSESGMALALTLMILVILTALVTEFSYGVYTATASLYNWRDSQKLSFVARSGTALAVKTLSDMQSLYPFTYPDKVELPVTGLLDNFSGNVMIRVEDENARFNLNSLVYPNGLLNTTAHDSFKRLLRNIGVNENIADLAADWIDRDNEPRLGNSEDNVKNAYLDVVDELLLIKGVERQVYEKLLPYVTVCGINSTEDSVVNVNTASIPVIMSMDDRITRELAGRIVAERDSEPFMRTSDLMKVAGFEGPLGQSLMGRIAVKSANFRITAAAEENKVKRLIESVVEIRGGGRAAVRFWKET